MEQYKIVFIADLRTLEGRLNDAVDYDFSNGEWTKEGRFIVVAQKRTTPSTDHDRYRVLYNSDYRVLQDQMNALTETFELIDGEIYCQSYVYLAIMCKPGGREIGGISDYTQMLNKPTLNGVTIVGNLVSSDLGLIDATSTNVLKNKTISATDNTIEHLNVSNFDSSIIDTGTLYITDNTHLATSKAIYEAIADSKRGFTFTGYVSSVEPSGSLKKNELWYESSTTDMPTTFPISVKRYDGTAWSTSTESYTPTTFDLWANKNNDKGYYWFGNAWNLLDFNAGVDNVTIQYNAADQLEVKDGGISYAKVATGNIATAVDETAPSNTKFVTESAVSTYVQQKVRFTFEQGSPSDTWVVAHGLNYYPSVTVIDSAGSTVIGDVTYNTANTLTIKFSGAMSGKVYLS